MVPPLFWRLSEFTSIFKKGEGPTENFYLPNRRGLSRRFFWYGLIGVLRPSKKVKTEFKDSKQRWLRNQYLQFSLNVLCAQCPCQLAWNGSENILQSMEVKRNVVYLSTFVKENVRNKIKILIPFFYVVGRFARWSVKRSISGDSF